MMKHLAATVALVALVGFGTSAAMAQAVILNAAGDLALGVNAAGQLNALDPSGTIASVNGGGRIGIAAKFADGAFHDATSPGCLCEGWGVSVNGTNQGSASMDAYSGGTSNLTVDSFTATASTITSSVHLTDLTGLSVVQTYGVATATDRLFVDHVVIANNTGAAVSDVKYVRAMDWDVPPTEFSEYVTIQGVATTTQLEYSNDNGFCAPNPLAGCSPLNGASENVSFTDLGPADHGAYFRFNFGTLANGASVAFDIFYGAATSQLAADSAVSVAGLELYSYGQNSSGAGGTVSDTPDTFIFGFKGVGGVVLIPTDPSGVPEPMSLALLGMGALAAFGARRRKQA